MTDRPRGEWCNEVNGGLVWVPPAPGWLPRSVREFAEALAAADRKEET